MPDLRQDGFSHRRTALILFLIALVPASISTYFHLLAPVTLAKEGVTWIHGISATFANWFGPWGVLIVRITEFPNAGLRSFNFLAAIGLTLVLVVLLAAAFGSRRRPIRLVSLLIFAPFAAVWFFLGFVQIADGLL